MTTCMSTHGGAGYSIGDMLYVYRSHKNPTIDIRANLICGGCGYKGKANPTGGRDHYYSFKENPWKWLRGEVKFTEPTWPEFLSRKYIYIK